MNSKQRVHAALRRQPVDRVPIFLTFHPEMLASLAHLLEIPRPCVEGVLGNDVRMTWVNNNTRNSLWAAIFLHWLYTYAVQVNSTGITRSIAYNWLEMLPYVLMALVVACFALAGSRVSRSGGTYGYVGRAFGPFAGFLAGVLYWLSDALAGSGVLSALASSAGVLAPRLGVGLGRSALILLVAGSLAFVNVRGVRAGIGLVQALTLAKLLPLVLLVCAGLLAVSPANLAWPGLPSAAALGDTVLLLVFAFVGVEVALAPSGEVRDPARTVPRAVFLALATTTLLYGVLQVVSVPIFLEGEPPDVLGRLTVGFFLDDRFANQIKRLTNSEIAFGSGDSATVKIVS